MTQYLLLKSDGEPDDPNLGLKSDTDANGGVLGGDNYEAAATSHNNYLELEEANSEYVAIDSQLDSSTITGMTVMAWVRTTDTSGEAIISSHDRSEYYRFNLVDGVFDCSFDTSGGGGDFSSGVNVADGLWHHLAAVYDAGDVRMYVDGRRVYTNTGNATEIGSGGPRYGFIGTGSEAKVFDGGIGPDNYANLDINSHRLYLDAKTDAEVEAAFEGNPPTTGLHEYLPLTSADGDRLNDQSGNGRHGYLRNGASVRNSGQFTSWYAFEDAEDADFSDWTVNEGTLSADSNQAIGDYSMFHDGMVGEDDGGTNDPRGAVKSLGRSEQIEKFSFLFWETSSNTSAALSLYNSDGQREFSLGTDNPLWGYDDAGGNAQWGNPGDYQHWMRFTITFNWSQSQYTVEGKDLQDGYTASHTGTMYHGKDIAEVASGQVGLEGFTGGGQWHLDQMYVQRSQDQTTPLSQPSVFGASSSSTTNPLGNTQASTLVDQQSGGFSESEVGKHKYEPQLAGDHISVPNINPSGSFSISFIIEGYGGNPYSRVFENSGSDGRVGFWERSNDTFFRFDSASTSRIAQHSYPVRFEEPTRITAVYDESVPEIRFYQDGAKVDTVSVTDEPFVLDGGFHVGPTNDDPTDWNLRDFRWYNDPLSDGEVVGVNSEMPSDNLELLYKFNEPGGPVLDTSGNYRHGTINGSPDFPADGPESLFTTQQSSPTTTTLSNALVDAFSASTFGGASTDTTAGGLTELFTHADQPATLDTSSVVEAFTESFDTVERTALGDALSTVTGDTTVATATGTQSLGNALAEPLVAAETAALTAQTSDSFADVYADVLRASGSALPTGASGDTAVTSLGTAEVATTTPQFDQAVVEIFAFVSPESATATPRVGGGETTTNAVALTEDAVMVPITPTMDVVIQVRPGQLGVEGNFADSLAASVGASTSIKVAKTVANADDQLGAADTSSVTEAFTAAASALEQSGSVFSDSTAEALAVAAALQTLGSSSSFTGVEGTTALADGTKVDADVFSSATPDAAVRDAVASELDASGDAHANPEVLAQAAQTLTEQGLADTQTEAAALVSEVVAARQPADVDTFAGVEGATEAFESIERVGRPSSFTLTEAAEAIFDIDSVDTDAVAEALPLISATLVSTVNVNGAASTDATSDGDVTGADMSPVDALLRILFASIEGTNAAIPITEQNVRVENAQNYAEVEN